MEDHLLIKACKEGDPMAQKVLFEQYSRGMLLMCRRYVGNYQDAEEVLLTGFHKFFSTIGRFVYSGDNSIGGWLKKIMLNECLLFLRKKTAGVMVEEACAEAVPISESVVEKMNVSEILSLINMMPDGYRLIFNLYVIEGYNHREIAEMLQVSEGTSKSQLSKARVYLQGLLKENEISYER